MTRRYTPVHMDVQQSLSILVPRTPNTAVESVASALPSDSGQLRITHGRKLLQRRPNYKFLVGAVASVISLVTTLVLLGVCRASQRRLNSGAVVVRSLLNMGDKEEQSDIVEPCLDLEEALGLRGRLSSGAAVRRNLSDRKDEEERSDIVEHCLASEEALGRWLGVSEHGEEASEGQARLVEMLYESAAAVERDRLLAPQGLQDETHIPPHKIARYDEPWPSTSHSQASVGSFWRHSSGVAMDDVVSAFDADAWAREESGLLSDGDVGQWHLAKLCVMAWLKQYSSALHQRFEHVVQHFMQQRQLLRSNGILC